MNDINWTEKRKAKRREILERFSFYICVPKLGYTRHKVNDISEVGIGFMLETFGEFTLANNETCELQFYLNQSLFVTLTIKVVRTIDRPEAVQEVGAIFAETKEDVLQTFATLVKLVEQLTESAEVT